METKETEFIYSERADKQQSFDKRLIEHVVSLVEQDVPRRDLVAQYGMSKRTLESWIAKYSNSSRRKIYSLSVKRSVVRAVESGMSIRQAQISFAISSDVSIRNWIKQFKEENVELGHPQPTEVTKKTVATSADLELKALKEALEEADLKIRALDSLIDIAQDRLKIDIRKKSGAKRSSK